MPFAGESTGDVVSAILRDEPLPAAQRNRQVSLELEAVIRKALEKDRNLRYQHASEVRADLQRLKRDSVGGRPQLGSSGTHLAAAAADGTSTATGIHSEGTVPPSASRRHKLLLALSLVAVIVAAVIGVAVYYRQHQAPHLTEKDTIVLAEFNNSTGDSLFDDALKQALAVQLAQSPYLKILSTARVNDTLRLIGRSPGERLTEDVARELCQRTESKAVLAGSIAQFGSRYNLTLDAINCVNGDELASTQAEAADKEHVLQAVGTMASEMRAKLGESLASIQKYDTHITEATTSSLQALKAYSVGLQQWSTKGESAGIPFFQRAVEIDPNFAQAYVVLGLAQGNLGQTAASSANITRGFQLRDRTSEHERDVTTAILLLYGNRGTGKSGGGLQTVDA